MTLDEVLRPVTLDEVLAQPDLARLARALQRSPGKELRPGASETARWAAIALLLRPGSLGEAELLLIKRAEAEHDPWSGHIACPGGRMEPADRDLAETATRETLEETAIDVVRVGRLLGTLDDVSPRTPVLPPIVIRPFVAVVPGNVEIVQSTEVAAAFWVPLSDLREPTAWSIGPVSVRGSLREERIFTHRTHVVWGLTERVLRQLLERVT